MTAVKEPPVVRFWIDSGKIRVQTEFEHKDRCKGIDGARWNPDQRTWDYPADHYTAQSLRDAFKGLGRAQADAGFRDLLAAVNMAPPPPTEFIASQGRAGANLPFDSSIDPRTVDPDTLPDIPVSSTPAWGHQKRGFWFIIQQFGGLPE